MEDRQGPTIFYLTGKTNKTQQCKETCLKLNSVKNTAVVCAWFTWHIANPTSHFV